MERPLVVLDSESATAHGAPHLLELGAVRVERGEVVDHFQALVRPQVPIDPEVTAIHGISDDMVVGAAETGEVLERFACWVGGDWMAAHRAEFDARVLGFEYARHRLAPPRGIVLDTLKLARKLIPEAPDHKLETLCHVLGLEEGVHHRALPDAVWCWKVLEACIQRLEERRTDAPAEAIGPSEEVGFGRLLALGGSPVTIERWQPRVARALKPRLRPLQRACEERLRVTLLYGGDPEPPVPLEVLPHILYDLGDNSFLEGECVRSGILKTYRLDRIHRVTARETPAQERDSAIESV